MKRPIYFLAIPVVLALAACRPGAAEYTDAEAPKQLQIDRAGSQLSLAFPAGSAQLSAAEVARLQHLAISGSISPRDRITIAAAGGPLLREQRIEAISRELLAFGITTTASTVVEVPRDRALITVGRYLVTLPACPNWSQYPASDFTNEKTSNFGCATAVNLGLMAASPSDLVGGRELAPADGAPAVSAVTRYLTDKVKLPETASGAQALAGGTSTGGAPAAGAAAPTGTQ